MNDTTLVGVLRERASLQPDDIAYTYLDYDQDPEGVPVTLTWAQLYRKVRGLAHVIRQHGAVGDRAVILAPQGLDTSSPSSAPSRPGSSRFRCRCRWAGCTMSGCRPCSATAGRR